MLNNIDKEIKCVSLENTKLKWVKMQNFHEIKVSRNMLTSKSRN